MRWVWRRHTCFRPAKRRGISTGLLAEADEKLHLLRERRVTRIELMKISPVAMIPGKAVVLLQALLHRQVDLAGAFAREVNEGSFVAPFLLARAIQECGFVAFFVAQNITESVSSGDVNVLAKLDERLMKGMTGAKSKEWRPDSEMLESLNILTVIDHVEKMIPGVRQAYEDLCEFCHPNCAGTLTPFTRLDEANCVCSFLERPCADDATATEWALRDFVKGVMAMNLALGIAEHYERDLVRLCEKQIYDQGTWPPTIPYPRG